MKMIFAILMVISGASNAACLIRKGSDNITKKLIVGNLDLAEIGVGNDPKIRVFASDFDASDCALCNFKANDILMYDKTKKRFVWSRNGEFEIPLEHAKIKKGPASSLIEFFKLSNKGLALDYFLMFKYSDTCDVIDNGIVNKNTCGAYTLEAFSKDNSNPKYERPDASVSNKLKWKSDDQCGGGVEPGSGNGIEPP